MTAPTILIQGNTNDQMPQMKVWCDHLHRMILGQAAQRILDNPHMLPAKVIIAESASWWWAPAATDMGRKDRRGTDQKWLMAVRISYDGGPLVLLTGREPVQRQLHAKGAGYDFDTTITITPTGVTEPRHRWMFDPDSFTVRSRNEAIRRLHNLVEDGKLARWELIDQEIETACNQAIIAGAANVRAELSRFHGHDVGPVLDDTGKGIALNSLLLGSSDPAGRRIKDRVSDVHSMLDRCLEPDRFLRVDVLRYATTDMRRSAEAQVREVIGDPHIGRQVRKVAADLNSHDVALIAAEFRRRYPTKPLGAQREEGGEGDVVARALAAAADPMSSWSQLDVDRDDFGVRNCV